MTDITFTCPKCAQRIELNGPMRDAILAKGCPVCSATVRGEHFESR
jgi:predicted nucleic acid-binding Zn ribbon protein